VKDSAFEDESEHRKRLRTVAVFHRELTDSSIHRVRNLDLQGV
jgi:hypothetical protein